MDKICMDGYNGKNYELLWLFLYMMMGYYILWWVIIYDYVAIVTVKGNDSGILIGRKYLWPI